LDALKEHIICNFEYLLAKLHSSSVFSLLSDLEVAFATVLDGDVYLILQAITKSVKILTSDPLQLASELLGHLRQLKGNSCITGKYSYIELSQCFFVRK